MLELSPYATREDVLQALSMASELERRRCEVDFGFFARRFWHTIEPATRYVHGPHIEAIVDHLDACLPRVTEKVEVLSDGTRLKVRKVEPGQIRKLLINMPPRHMKLLDDETPVPTPDGVRRHGDLKVGDQVFGSDGLPAKVVAISPDAPADLEVEFSTGEVIRCNGDHLWRVLDRHGRVWRTLDTSDLLRLHNSDPGRSRFFIPDAPCLSFPSSDLPLDPYFLGCWLGDGSSTKPCITHAVDDRAHIDAIVSRGLRISTECSGGTVTYFSGQGVLEALRALGVLGRKSIPEIYQRASEAQRLDLLAGLIDTDGSVEPSTSRVRYSTCDERIRDDVFRLVVGLGFHPYITAVPAPGYGEYSSDKTCYQVCFQPTRSIPTQLARKRIVRTDPAHRLRAIRSVRRAASPGVGHCITVDRDDGLYVAGSTHVVTHNSTLVSVLWPAYVWARRPEFRWLFTSYSKALAIRDTMRMRAVLMSPHYQYLWASRFRLLPDQNEKSKFFNTSMGYRVSGSVESGVTGEGGDGVICFPWETLVQTEVGPLPIGQIVDGRLPVRVWSYDRSTGASRLSPISGWHSNPGSPLVRVSTPGGSFRCTPDHRILTRRGWVEARQLGPLDVLPRASVPDSCDHGLVDSQLACDGSIGLAGAQHLLDVLLGDFGLRVLGSDFLVRSLSLKRFVRPTSSASDSGDVPLSNSQSLGQLESSLRSLQDSLHILVRQFGIRGLASCLDPLGSDGILDVVASGPVCEVFDSVVQRVSVKVSRVLSCLPLPDECFCDELVNEALERLSVLAQVDAPVPAVCIQFKRPSWYPHRRSAPFDDSRNASCVSVTGDHVEPLESCDVSPLFVSGFGHCDTSYCLTVEPDHNFILCVGGDNIVVSNCDDPHNVHDADSERVRETTENWWFESMSTRLNDPDTGFHVAVFQRVHEKDIAAKCIERGYVHLNLPARYDPKRSCVTVLGWKDWRTEEGQLLWPDRFSEPTMVALETDLGAYGTASQLQQDPKPRGGAFIKREWFKRVDAKNLEKIVGGIFWGRGWDLALNKEGDLVAGVEGGFDGDGNFYLRRGVFWHEDSPISEERIELIGEHERNRVVVEAIGTTRSMGLSVAARLSGKCLVEVIDSKENKVSMAIPWISLAQAGKVFLVEEADASGELDPSLRGSWPFYSYNKVAWIDRFLDVATSWKPDPTLSQVDDPIDAVSLVYHGMSKFVDLKRTLVPGVLPGSITDGHAESVDPEDDDFDEYDNRFS